MISAETLAAYEAWRRPAAERSVVCHAPFVSLNFEQTGRVTACCYNRKVVLGEYPRQSVAEIWGSQEARAFREAFLEKREAPGCELCFVQLQSRNFAGALLRSFDQYSESAGYHPAADMPAPLVLELEISNTCNLECVMCGGFWSSSIRSRREHLPPLHSPYDREFTRQLEAFLPSVVAAKFLGGEPFLIRRYYDIWESITRLNPRIEVSITTNATFLPPRARVLLEGMRADIVISLDALTRETYEKIRVNAKFDTVMEHVEWLLAYTRRKDTGFTLAVCPMTWNWRELDRIVDFCEERNVGLHFNTVTRPASASLAGLTADELAEVVTTVRAIVASRGEKGLQRTWGQVNGLAALLEDWRAEKVAFAERCHAQMDDVRTFAIAVTSSEQGPLSEPLQNLLGEFVRGYRIEIEREHYDYFELQDLLARRAFGSPNDPAVTAAAELILAAQLFTCYLGTRGADAVWAREKGRLKYLALRDGLRQPKGRGGFSSAKVEELGCWIGEQLTKSNITAIVIRMTPLLESGGRHQTTEERTAQSVMRRLPSALASMCDRGYDEESLRRIARFAAGMVADRGQVVSSLLDDDLLDDPAVAGAPPVISDAYDVRCALEALYVYHVAVAPLELHESFRRRIDDCITWMVTPERAVVVARSMSDAGLIMAYSFLSAASDEQLATALGSVA